MITFNHDNFIGDIAYIVENDVLLHSILKELEPFANITIRNDAKIDNVLLERDGLPFGKVRLATGENFTAELLVNISFSFVILNLFFIFYIIIGVTIDFRRIQLIENVIKLRAHR